LRQQFTWLLTEGLEFNAIKRRNIRPRSAWDDQAHFRENYDQRNRRTRRKNRSP